AADERRHVPAENTRPAPGEDEDAAEHAAREVQQLEAALEERGGGFGDEDRSGLAALDERRQHLDRLLPGLDGELRHARCPPHEALCEMDPDRHGRRPRILLARPCGGLLDRHGGVRGPTRRVLRRVEPERGHDARRAHPLDAPAEARDLLDQDPERAARLARIVLESPSISGVTSGSGAKSVTRSMRLASSRTLPGQGYARSAACAAAVRVLGGTP